MNATVIIVTYNRFELLKECLICVENQTKKFDNVVIIDNKCTDGTTDYLKKRTQKYHIIFESENGGGAKGFKDGVEFVHKKLSTDWILLIDDDAMLEPNYLEMIDKASNEHPNCKAFSGSVKTDNVIDITHRKILQSGLTFKVEPVNINKYSETYFEYDLSSFCGLMFHKSLIDKVGYPRAEYFIWYDDSEYSLRLRKETKIINVNSTYINHKTKKSNGSSVINWRGYYGTRNCGDVIKHHGTPIQYFLYCFHIRMAQYKNRLLSFVSKNKYYSYSANLYKDALDDLKKNLLGYNPKYHA